MNSFIQDSLTIMFLLYGLGAVTAIFLARNPKLANYLPNGLNIAAAIFGIGASLVHLTSGTDRLYLANLITSVPYISFEASIDRLSAFFILALSILTLAVSIYSLGYLTHYYGKRNLGLFNFLLTGFIMAMAAVLISANLIAFLFSWELMSIISYFLVIFEADNAENQRAGTVYLIMTHLATAFLIIAFGLMFKYGDSLAISSPLVTPFAWVKNTLFICFLISFGTKAGIIPFHIWLPQAHPAAPSNVSALMSGMMIKIAIYGLIRFVIMILGSEYQWWGSAILIIGIITVLLGAAYALVEKNIKKLLAYCSIENIGIIFIGLGVTCITYNSGLKIISALALTAMLFHLLNHTLIKGTLFFGAGAIQYATHTKNMEQLGGLIKKMPYTGLFLLIASVAISALPPLNGFISEWLTFQALFAHILAASFGFKVLLILTVAALAMAGSLAVSTFIKFFGISFLGNPRDEHLRDTQEVPAAMLWGMGFLTGLSLVVGTLPLVIIRLLDKVIVNITGISIFSSMQGTWFFAYYPLTISESTVNPMLLLLTGGLLLFLLLIFHKVLGSKVKERRYGTWDCGFPKLNPRMQYSATGFSKPLQIIFRAIYRPNRELEIEQGPTPYFPKSLKYVVTTESIFEKYLYLPITSTFTKFARWFRMAIQTGSIHLYLIYIFVTILLLLVYYRCCG